MTNEQQVQDRLRTFLQSAIDRQVFPGASIAVVWDGGEQTTTVSAGTLRYAEASLVSNRTLYDVASVTKSVITSTLALLLIQQGKLHVSDRVQSWQGYEGSDSTLTVHHLLTHTASFGVQLSSLKDRFPAEILEAVRGSTLLCKPGERYAYVNASSILLGLELERLTGRDLATLAQELILSPVGMHQSHLGKVLGVDVDLHIPRAKEPRANLIGANVAPAEVDSWRRGEVAGEVHDESSWKLMQADPPHFSGAAGLFTTAQDMNVFLSAYLQGEIIGTEMLAACATDQRGALNMLEDETAASTPIGLGWELAQPHWMGQRMSSRTIGKTGFTGSCVVMDLDAGVGVALLCNHIYPKRPVNREKINATRRHLFDLVASLL